MIEEKKLGALVVREIDQVVAWHGRRGTVDEHVQAMQIAMAMTRDGAKSESLGELAAVERECERIGVPLALEGKTQFFGR